MPLALALVAPLPFRQSALAVVAAARRRGHTAAARLAPARRRHAAAARLAPVVAAGVAPPLSALQPLLEDVHRV